MTVIYSLRDGKEFDVGLCSLVYRGKESLSLMFMVCPANSCIDPMFVISGFEFHDTETIYINYDFVCYNAVTLKRNLCALQ